MPAPARYDIHAFVHKGLRACLTQTLVSVGCLDWTDNDDVSRTLDGVRDLLDFCQRHARAESEHLHPAIERRRPGAAARAMGEHERHARDIDALAAQVFTVRMLPALRREEPAHRLYRQLCRFVADSLERMAREEHEHNAILWETHSDEELMALERTIMASLPPREALRWMLPAMNPPERARLLTGIRDCMPADVVDDCLRMLRPLLPSRDMKKLNDALGIRPVPIPFVGIP